jgi:acyl dehydratase
VGEERQVDRPPHLAAYIGMESEAVTAWDPVESGAVRRFTQALMDPDPHYWDEELAARSRYGGRVAPPLFTSHSGRRAADAPDPFDHLVEHPDLDGTESGFASVSGGSSSVRGLPAVDAPQSRALNGGVEAEFLSLPNHGDRIISRSRYVDVYERPGKDGPMLFIVAETTYENQDGRVLSKVRNTMIRR